MKKILKNLLIAIGIITYFAILVLAYTRMNLERLSNDIQVFAGTFLVLGILTLEKAYKKDSGKIAIVGIELLVLSFHSLSIMHMVNIFKCDFHFYLLISSAIVGCYYILKGIIIYTKDRREYLRGLSDISEIVKEEEPIKKEAKKRNDQKEAVKEKVKNKQKENAKVKKGTNPKKKSTTKKKATKTKKDTTTKNLDTDNKKTQTKKTEIETKKKVTTKTKKEVKEND